MKSLDHIVKQLSFDIQINGGSSTTVLHESVANYCADNSTRDLEKQLKPYNNQHAIINRIELDLGTISSVHWEKHFKETLESVFQQQLEASFSQEQDGHKAIMTPSLTPFQEKSKTKRLHKSETIDEDSSHEIFKAFCYFLEKGYLPWWYSTETSSSFENLHNYKLTPYEVAELWELLKNNRKALKRFLATVPINKIPLILNSKGTIKNIVTKKTLIHKALLRSITPSLSKKSFQYVFWKTLITHYKPLQSRRPKAISQFLIALLLEDDLQTKISSRTLEKKALSAFKKGIQDLWPNGKIDMPLIEQALNSSTHSLEGNRTTSHSKSSKVFKEITPIISGHSEIIRDQESLKSLTTSSKVINSEKEKDDSEPKRKEEQEGVYVVYAGVVLLHPLLASFFTNLQLLENGKWVNTVAPIKAVHLLAYVCTGIKQFKEEECLLFKHLCGLEWDALTDLDQGLSVVELHECEELLKAVLKHWKALKNTSIDGIREGFIQRSGKLYKDDYGWQLHIEQKAQDILLKHLPWGMGIIKFPWLDNLLRITWM